MRSLVLFAGSSLLAACGAGTAGIIASADGGESSSTPALNAFAVLTPKISPAGLRLDATKAVQIALFYDAGAGEQPMTQVSGPGVAGNQVGLPAGVAEIEWDFAAELGSASFAPGVQLAARLSGGALLSGGQLTVDLGNDPPVVVSVEPTPTDPAEPSESSGNVEVRLVLSDSSSDVVSILVDWRRTSDAIDAWQPATAAGVFPAGVATTPTGVTLSFFWNTNVDLFEGEDDVLLRVTADDATLDARDTPIGISAPLVSAPLHIDNNDPPIVQLDSGPIITNPDERRGIPIPFRVIDNESDLVDVIFQWRRDGEEFVELPSDDAALDAILADPLLRRQYHICTPSPHFAQGRVVPIDADTVRLPELASSESWILASALEGRTLELYRRSSVPTSITSTWTSNPLVHPIAALPWADGLTALVLDVPANGRLREIDLATGAVVREIATLGRGMPSAMTAERGELAMLVAVEDTGSWRIERVDLASGSLSTLVVSDNAEPAPVRGIASLGTSAAVFTAGASLLHVDYRDPLAPQLGTLLTDLATPWGVVVDPLLASRIYVSERDSLDGGRLVSVDLDTHGTLPVVVKTADLQLGALDAPEAFAFERQGARALLVTSAPSGHQLVALDLGATGGNRSVPIGEPTATDVADVSTGSEQLRLVCLPTSNEILVAGGIEQRRVIATRDAASPNVSVEQPFDPVPSHGQPWRLADQSQRSLRASPEGVATRFIWDSTDAVAGLIFLRASARDDEFGIAVDGGAPKRVRGGLEVAPLVLGGDAITVRPRSVVAADLDGDGDLDLCSANLAGDNLTVFFQIAPASFAAAPLVLGGSTTTNGARSVAAADLDGDGDLDLVSANRDGDTLTIFTQYRPGGFEPNPSLTLGGFPITNTPVSVVAADLDGDGDLDLVSANLDGNNLTVFFQLTAGAFDVVPFTLGGFSTTFGPLSVAAADLDGDGDLDLVCANRDGDNLTIFFQVAPGSFATAPLTLGDSTTTDNPNSVAAADLDGDGDIDLCSSNGAGHNLTVFFQLSPGGFEPNPSLTLGGFPIPNTPVSVAAADVDSDGDIDLCSANQNGDNLTVFFQALPGSFAPAPLTLGGPATTVTPVCVAAADLDGDGDLELVSANDVNGGNDLTVFFQASPGSFDTAPLELGGTGEIQNPASVAAADLDGDGDLDLVLADEVDDELAIYHQISPGNFSSVALTLGDSTTTQSPRSLVAADVDGDGDLDLACANFAGDNVTVFFRNAPGSFEAVPLTLGDSATTNGPSSLATADLDGDGDLDLVSANYFSHTLTIFWNNH